MSDIVLLTGGLGYLGGRISRYLAESSHFNLRLGVRSPETAIPKWLKNGELVVLDLFADSTLESACKGVKYIIHLAALNEIDSATDPERALLVNGVGSLKLLLAAIKTGVKRFIYFSTAHVYGSPLTGNITEETIPRPLHPYAITHRTAEDFVLAAHDKKQIEGVVVRLSNGIGAPERANINRWTLLANDLCRQAVVEKKLILRTHGLQYRDFVTLNDVSRAVLHMLMLSPQSNESGLFNLGGDNSTRIIDMAERIAERCEIILGFRPKIFRPSPDLVENILPLSYRIEKLKATGFVLLSDVDEEIDATLKLCVRSFGAKS